MEWVEEWVEERKKNDGLWIMEPEWMRIIRIGECYCEVDKNFNLLK